MLNAQFIMLASIFCFSLAGYFSSLLAIHLLALSMLIRFFIPTLFSFIKMRSFAFLKKSTRSTFVLATIRGLVIFSSQYLLYITIHKLGLAPGLILYNLGPIFLVVLFTMLGNSLKIQDIVLMIFSFIGVLVFFDFEFKAENMGILLGITAAVLYAVSQYINADMARRNEDPKTIILLVNFSATIIAAIYLFVFVGPPPRLIHLHYTTLGIIFAMGLATYFNQYLRIIAFKLVDNPNTIVYLTYFCIPFSLVFTLVDGKSIVHSQIYGAGIILLGALTQVYLSRKAAKKSEPQAVQAMQPEPAAEPEPASFSTDNLAEEKV
jgi:drug/metabolite transporter (DMT)-like permease